MALKFRLRGLAETFIDVVTCRKCGVSASDDQLFSTELTKVTLEGIVVIVQCKNCGEIFVPENQRLGIVNPGALKLAVERDSQETGEPLLDGVKAARLAAEHLNAQRKGELQ